MELKKLKEVVLEPKKLFIINNPIINKKPDSFIDIDSIIRIFFCARSEFEFY